MNWGIIGKYFNYRKNVCRKDRISLEACEILLIAEVVFITASYLPLPEEYWSIKLLIIVVWFCVVLFQWCQFKKETPRSSSNLIMSKLLSNAISPRRLGIIYLFLFVVHLGWITNSSYDLVKAGTGGWLHPVLSFVVAFMGTIILILFFPDAIARKVKQPKKIFISGMSRLKLKDYNGKNLEIPELNIFPLISALKFA